MTSYLQKIIHGQYIALIRQYLTKYFFIKKEACECMTYIMSIVFIHSFLNLRNFSCAQQNLHPPVSALREIEAAKDRDCKLKLVLK